MVYKGKNFDPSYHYKKNFNRSLQESNYDNSNFYNNYNHNHSYTAPIPLPLPPPPPPPIGWTNNPFPSRHYGNYKQNSERYIPSSSSKKKNRKREVDGRPGKEAAGVNNNTSYTTIDNNNSTISKSNSNSNNNNTRIDGTISKSNSNSSNSNSNSSINSTISKNNSNCNNNNNNNNNSSSINSSINSSISKSNSNSNCNSNNNDNHDNNNNNNNNIGGSSSSSSTSGKAKKLKTPLEKLSKMEDHLERNPNDKLAHVNAYRIYGANIRKAPEGREWSRTPTLAPQDNYMDDTDKDEAELQQQELQQQQQWSSLSAQAATPYQDLHQNWNATGNNHHYQNKIRQSSVATTSSTTTTATPTDNRNPWTRSPSAPSSPSHMESPASSTTDFYPELSRNPTLNQSYNWTDQDEPGTGASMERLPSESVQPCQQSEKEQPSQSQPHLQLDTMVPSLALQAVDEKINFLDHLWKSGNDKLSQTVKVAEQSILTCVLRQVVEEIKIYAALREMLQSQVFKGQIDSIGTLTEMMQRLEATRKFDITCLQPGVPIPDTLLDQSVQAMDTMKPLLATSNGEESMTMHVPEIAVPPPPPYNVEEPATLSSDQPNLANSSNPRKRALEQTDSDQTQGNRATIYHDMDSGVTEDREAVHQSSLDATATTPTTITTLPALDRPYTPSRGELQVASTTSPSLSLNSRSSSISSTSTTRTSKWDRLMPNKPAGTAPPDNSRADSPALQQNNSVPPALANSTPASGNMEQAIGTTSDRISNGGRAMMDIEKELRLIREEGQEQRLRTEQLLAQLESEARLRREADHRVSQLAQELKNERCLTLEKDLESKRSEALLMMAKAREDIQQGKALFAQAKEELAMERAARAEAMIETARIEIERNRLLAYVQSLGGPSAVISGGLFVGGMTALPPTSAATLSARFPSPAGSDGGVLVTAPGSGGPPSVVDAETPSGQVNRNHLIETAIPVKVEGSL
ncbi:hypothetical protein EC957_002686 [Mortierella hygrophila]|uniref:Uncharacterized protein n=1 Tax=Mortierella hygrophila TaxID=979708 RepID=A0A9P6F319_9FUNG|nr:hypothetical protein EC957_002686 [Mortierella hygrophila]